MNFKRIKIEEEEVNTQLKAVMFHLKEKKSIKSWEAIKLYGITRLSHYIHLLREDGYNIETEDVTVETRFKKANGEKRTATIAVYHYISPKEGKQGVLFN